MFRLTLISIFATMGAVVSCGISPQLAYGYNFTLQDGTNSATYDDDNNLGFIDWQVDGNDLVTQTGLFYRLGSTGTAQSIRQLNQSSSNPNTNPATVTYTDSDFALDLISSLSNSGSTLTQTATVTNTSDSTLDFYLYYYLDLATSNGAVGDSVTIESNTYTATQSGDLGTIVTIITESIVNGNPTLIARSAEADAIDFNDDDTLFDKLQSPAGTPQLDGELSASSAIDPVTIAYEWNYSLAANDSFAIEISNDSAAIEITSNSVSVPFEFSPSLGILLVGIFSSGHYLVRKRRK